MGWKWGRVETEIETHTKSLFVPNKYYTITLNCYNYTTARPKFEVAAGNWGCPRRAFHCSFVSDLGHVRPAKDTFFVTLASALIGIGSKMRNSGKYFSIYLQHWKTFFSFFDLRSTWKISILFHEVFNDQKCQLSSKSFFLDFFKFLSSSLLLQYEKHRNSSQNVCSEFAIFEPFIFLLKLGTFFFLRFFRNWSFLASFQV